MFSLFCHLVSPILVSTMEVKLFGDWPGSGGRRGGKGEVEMRTSLANPIISYTATKRRKVGKQPSIITNVDNATRNMLLSLEQTA